MSDQQSIHRIFLPGNGAGSEAAASSGEGVKFARRMWERRAGKDSRREVPPNGGADVESTRTATATPADSETRVHVRRPSAETGVLSGVANMKVCVSSPSFF